MRTVQQCLDISQHSREVLGVRRAEQKDSMNFDKTHLVDFTIGLVVEQHVQLVLQTKQVTCSQKRGKKGMVCLVMGAVTDS